MLELCHKRLSGLGILAGDSAYGEEALKVRVLESGGR